MMKTVKMVRGSPKREKADRITKTMVIIANVKSRVVMGETHGILSIIL